VAVSTFTYSFNRIVRLNSDGSIDSSFSVGSGFDKNVYALAFQSDNKLIVGGHFNVKVSPQRES
jgi:hypothetical protein